MPENSSAFELDNLAVVLFPYTVEPARGAKAQAEVQAAGGHAMVNCYSLQLQEPIQSALTRLWYMICACPREITLSPSPPPKDAWQRPMVPLFVIAKHEARCRD